MLESLRRQLQDVQYGDVQRRKKWVVIATVLCFVAVIFLWLFVFGIRQAESEHRTQSTEGPSLSEFWSVLENSAGYVKQGLSASMNLISDIPAGTPGPSAIPSPSPSPEIPSTPDPSVIQLH